MATAQLLIVAGPDSGRHASLRRPAVLIGRHERADIVCSEPHISRQQAKMQQTPDGWIVENLADRPMKINGKKYRQGKQVLLDTGDAIAIGAETVLLFVDAGDDPAEVLSAWQGEQPGSARPAAAEPAAIAAPAPAEEAQPPAAPAPVPAPAPAPLTPAEPEEDDEDLDEDALARKAKLKKYAIGFGIYLVVMAVVIVLLSTMGGRKGREELSQPERLTSEQLEDAFTSQLSRSPNAVAADRHLALARQFFEKRTASPENLYLCVLNYRLYQAYCRPSERVFQPQDERSYKIARSELLQTIEQIYNDAWAYENGQRWQDAYREYERLLRHVPIDVVAEHKDRKVQDVFVENVTAHNRYVSRNLRKKRR